LAAQRGSIATLPAADCTHTVVHAQRTIHTRLRESTSKGGFMHRSRWLLSLATMFLVACAVESVPVSSQDEAEVTTPAAASDGTVTPLPGGPTTNDISCFRQCLASCGDQDDCGQICACVCLDEEYCH
jgi:hypothetical protein